ncbi:PHP domain-containing protein [Micromonospora okii]|uniref:PHP domain-containing protein n=1 Tax=Micromonospora okii TaxID=1182970 RepID=UPI001E5D8C85|nr:PHP domain-containing protein [Micromonospora okii]
MPCTGTTPVDLHVHTRRSDGDDPPAAVAARCLAAGLRVVSVVDHNTMGGVEEFTRAVDGRMTVIPGCEITAEWRGEEVHCLAYFVDPGDARLCRRLRDVHDGEVRWWRTWTERVASIGVPLTPRRVTAEIGADRVAYVGDYLALLADAAGDDPRFAGYGPDTYGDIAADWCRPGQPLHVPVPWRPDLTEVLAWVTEAGGVAVLAHPAPLLSALDDARCRALLEPLAEAGLGGLEVWTSWHRPADSARLAQLCAAAGLVATAGSDYHGTRVKPWVPEPGRLPTPPGDPMAIVDALHERRPSQLPARQNNDH